MRWAVLFRAMIWLTVLAVPGTGLVAPTARAQDVRSRAREQFQRGVAAFEAGRYEEALAAFQEAFRLKPHPSVRLNMAACYEELDRPLEALVHYRAYLAEASDAPRERVREVKAAIRKAERRVARLQLDVAPDGARVTIDETESRRSPVVDPILLNPGEHSVRVEMAGYAPLERRVRLRAGERKRLQLRLQEGTGAQPAVGAETPTEASRGGAEGSSAEEAAASRGEAADEGDAGPSGASDTAPLEDEDEAGAWRLRLTDRVLYASIATGAAALVWVGTGIAALGAEGTYEDELARANDPRLPRSARVDSAERARSAADTANTLAAVSDVFLVLTVAGLGVTGWFAWQDGSTEEASTTAAVVPARDGGMLVVRGSF